MFKTITAATVLFTASAFAQSADEQAIKIKTELDSRMLVISSEASAGPTVAGAPYYAEETDTTTQTLFDGNRIVNTSTTKAYRDQQGRTRVERTLSNIGPMAAGQPIVSITINDPVANARYALDPQSKTAFRGATSHGGGPSDEFFVTKTITEDSGPTIHAEGGSLSYSYSTTRSTNSAVRREDLGTSNMAGVSVKGTRTTRVIPAGTMGNDRDINIVDERWYSPDLKMNIMTKHTDPRMGETVFQVTNLTRSNPDPSLFQVPSDYQVKDGPKVFKFTTTKE